LTGLICIRDKKTDLSWPVLTQIFTAIGAQTLAIRGSEKSMYGKLFEKFILGSLLTILGFSFVDINKLTKKKMVFWLSERGDKRESDATALIQKGKGVRFDIGFIGPGNTEISLDKVSRFETEMKLGRQKHYMTTLIIVDRIGEGSRITDMANEIGGNIVQMSMAFWVRDVAKILHETTGFKHDIRNMNDRDSLRFIKESMKKVELRNFI
jgi:CfrBI-like restriction endonuclease